MDIMVMKAKTWMIGEESDVDDSGSEVSESDDQVMFDKFMNMPLLDSYHHCAKSLIQRGKVMSS